MGDSARRTPRVVAADRPRWSTAGALAASAWLNERSLLAPASRWHVEVALDVRDGPALAEFDEHLDTRFHVAIYSEEWGFFFCHGGRASWIRVTDVVFVHVRDDFRLLTQTPALKDIGLMMRRLER